MNIDNRYNVTASLFMLREMKKRHEQVHRGHELLKRKAEALRIRSRHAASDLCETYAKVIPSLREAYISLAAAKFSNGEYNPNAMVLENLGQAQVRVFRAVENTSGVTTINLLMEEGDKSVDPLRLAGLGVGGHRLSEAKKAFREALLRLIEFASLRYTCVILDEAMRATMRKVNGISKVIIPKLQNTEKYILTEMDEREREEFHRLKMVKAKKLRTQTREAISKMRRDKSRQDPYTGDNRAMIPMQQVSAFHANERLMSMLYPVSSRTNHSDSGDDVSKPFCFPHYWDDEDLLF